ncbi:MAG: N-6 DNA methylase [Planctomycetota bacterium]|nr:N-6 DNA methylase [Planctomycetota bacterium]
MQLTFELTETNEQRKLAGAYYTPSETASSLVCWVLRKPTDRLLDPACGDGQFLQFHDNRVGVEQDAIAAARARLRAPGATVHDEDFFAWAKRTPERFDCAAGNPPFIRYQRFSGKTRQRALDLCQSLGARFSSLSSSWAFLSYHIWRATKPPWLRITPAVSARTPYMPSN